MKLEINETEAGMGWFDGYEEGERMNGEMTITIPLKHVEAVQDALLWASEEAVHEFDAYDRRAMPDWRYKRYELALDLLDAEVRQAERALEIVQDFPQK